MAWSEIDGSLERDALAAQFRAGALRPTELVRAVFARIRACPADGIWINLVAEADALAAAAALEARVEPRLGPDRLPLYGLPFGAKDNIDAAGVPTTAACPDFAYVPVRSAPALAACIEAGAILIGKTNLDQFATGLVGTRSPYGACSSAFDVRYISGGSSSGSAVAVARGHVSFALGTDTGGSGRIPAGFNDVVGLKPTRGLVSTTGLVPACRSLDCVSVFARRATDARAVLQAMRGYDASNGFSRPDAGAPLGEAWRPATPFQFGVLAPREREFFGNDEGAAHYAAALERLSDMGGAPIEIDFAPFREAGDLLFAGPWIAERYADIGPFIAAHPESVLPVTRQIIESGARFSAAELFAAEHRLRMLHRQAQRQIADLAFLVVPTAARPYTLAEVAADPVATNTQVGRYSYFVNLLDLCAHAVPNGRLRNGMPTGITLIAPPMRDDTLASFASAYQARLDAAAGRLGN
ncbi:MAG TPA: allophanate hydrolase [Candidatus Sulfotelmatobacter sp.]|nr:allophanate hydrolase [Candidatus Sulfotelmatobacter sp.]